MAAKFKISSKLECDVLVIGAGGAGLRCATEILERKPGTKSCWKCAVEF